jgi:hypothetical protein
MSESPSDFVKADEDIRMYVKTYESTSDFEAVKLRSFVVL